MKALILLLLISLKSYAGIEVGNGGDVIVCKDKIELLDYFEAKQNKLEPIVSKKEDYMVIATDILTKFKKTDQKLAEQYLRNLKDFPAAVEFKKGMTLRDIKDSKHDFIPSGCELKQIAIRRWHNITNRGGKKFIISRDLWEKLTPTERAGLVLHEIIFEHFIYLKVNDSNKARFMNGVIAHLANDKELKIPYRQMLQNMSLPIYR